MIDLLTRLLALARIGIGAAILLRPEDTTGDWVGDEIASADGGHVLARGLAMRDIGIGIGSLAASSRGRDGETMRWLAAGVVADLADTVDTFATADIRSEQATRTTGGLALAGLVTGLGLIAALRRRSSRG